MAQTQPQCESYLRFSQRSCSKVLVTVRNAKIKWFLSRDACNRLIMEVDLQEVLFHFITSGFSTPVMLSVNLSVPVCRDHLWFDNSRKQLPGFHK